MELTVYRQAMKERPDGTIVYKGEDARPYVDDRLIMVADGLGGAAAIRHLKFNQDMFDKDKLMDALFQGVYDDYSDENFCRYVTDSFFELFAVKDCYTDNVNNIKKSGYFASRIVAAIILHEMTYNKNVDPARIFELYHKADKKGKAEALLAELGKHFTEVVREDLKETAEHVNLVYESSYSGLALLGTTLCLTIYLEKEDTVEAVYLTAGDSRPYVWTEKEGLRQIADDEEREDGGMTNYIKANEDAEFTLRCEFKCFKKPCVLFNASDGCFDSGYFLSPLAFEKLILDKALEAENEETRGSALYESFLTLGRHDDSSTIAMKFFGFESFSAFRESAEKRLEQLNKEYFEQMPDLLDDDYMSHQSGEEGLSEKGELQKALFDQYEKTYGSLMRGTVQ